MCSAAGPFATALKQSARQAGCFVTFTTLNETLRQSVSLGRTVTQLPETDQATLGRALPPSLRPLLEAEVRSLWGLEWMLPQVTWKALPSPPGTEDGARELHPHLSTAVGALENKCGKHRL